MAVAAYNATIKEASTTIADIMTYDLPFKMDLVETTAFSTATPGTKTFVPTLLGAQIKASGNWNKSDTGQAALETAFFARTSLSMVFSPDGTHTYTCTCYISDYDVKADPKDVVKADFTLVMTGGVTVA